MNRLEFAIQMENDGQKFYSELAEANKDNRLSTLFRKLANDEKIHAEILSKRLKDLPYELSDNEELLKYENAFASNREMKNDIRSTLTQLDVYQAVLDRELKSIELYQDMRQNANQGKDKILLDFLVFQETAHAKIFQGLVELLERPEEWVEDAEFGIRDEY
ncbi:MAG TPA: rubrerythrin [Erysipelotrichaceae bacterium]|nr:MAG: hypothetical protein A2Y19_09990 [Firmicutes bacterium GWE2_51_13]HAM62518.1 rubrerythrin [Erysipelotrichaceae bacterium]HAO61776.1 rubrerythrin [Erysipelotrichaceae bacterium]